jgi:hypothetical protein
LPYVCPELEFLKSLRGLGTEEEEGYRTGPPGYLGWRNSFLGIDSGAQYTFKNTGWSKLDHSAIPVSISAVSITSRQTWQNLNSKRRLQRIQNVQEGKRQKKKRHLAAFVSVSSVFGEKFPTAGFGMIS